MGIKEDLGAIERYEDSIAKLQEQIAGVGQNLQIRRDRVRDFIRHGQTTGDRICDYAIAHIGRPVDEVIDFYRMLDTGVRDHQGELTLVVRCSVEPLVFSIMPTGISDDNALREKLELAVIEGELDLPAGKPDLALPVSRSISYEGSRRSVRKKEGNALDIMYGPWSFEAYRKPVTEPYMHKGLDPQPAFQLDILLGDAAVVAWFAERGSHNLLLFRDLCRELDYPLPSSNELEAAVAEERAKLLKSIQEDEEVRGRLLLRIETHSRDGQAHAQLAECMRHLRFNIARAEEIGLGEEPDVKRVRDKIGPAPAEEC